jgi:membrane protein YdbS with pleckstrin-like domain
MFCFLVMQKCVKTTSGSGLQNLAPFRKLGMVLVSKVAPVWKLGMVLVSKVAPVWKLGMVLVSKVAPVWKLGMVPSLTTRTYFFNVKAQNGVLLSTRHK